MTEPVLMKRYKGRMIPLNEAVADSVEEVLRIEDDWDEFCRIAGVSYPPDSEELPDNATEEIVARNLAYKEAHKAWQSQINTVPWCTDDGLAVALLQLYGKVTEAGIKLIWYGDLRRWACSIEGSLFFVGEASREPFEQEGTGDTMAEAVCRAITDVGSED